MHFDADIYRQRRHRLRAAIGDDAAAIVASPSVSLRSADGTYPYRADSNVLYLTGFDEPEAVALILPEAVETPFVLFVPARDPEKEQWLGRRAGVDGAIESYGADAAHPLDEMRDELEPLLDDIETLYLPFGADHGLLDRSLEVTRALRNQKNRHRGGPRRFADLDFVMGRLRIRKEPGEIELIRKACHISVLGHLAAQKAIRPGVSEHLVEAEINYAFRREGASGPAYETIVGAGDNATILHYVRNDSMIQEGDAVLVDAGAEYAHYAGDITRTYPAAGRFTPEQKAIYELVLEAQLAAIEAVGPDAHYKAPHEAALEILIDGLLQLELLEGSHDEIVEEETYKRFFMHGTSHYLGLDTHDAGEYYERDDTPVPLEPGMVLTVEPGLYVSADDEEAPSRFRGIGVRIEDDVLVTAEGHEVLTSEMPKQLRDMER